MNQKILLVGCGKMGSALLKGWLAKGIPASGIVVVQPSGNIRVQAKVQVVSSVAALPRGFVPDMVVLATKPQVMGNVLKEVSSCLAPHTVCVSIAAGKTLAFFAEALGSGQPVVRAMPNLPATIGQGVTVLCANTKISTAARQQVNGLFEAAGKTFWLEQEALMDAVTAISGSGPAYVFYFMEALSNAAQRLGLPEELAVMLVQSTVRGSAELASRAEESFAELKIQVVSPKGTTEAGLSVLAGQPSLEELMQKTAEAACHRSKELAG